MTWSLSAGGHTPTPEGAENWAQVEQELHDELHAVLSNPKYGATHSSLSGNFVTGSPHLPKAEHAHGHAAAAHEDDADAE